jgi:bifunctional DNase/RNase
MNFIEMLVEYIGTGQPNGPRIVILREKQSDRRLPIPMSRHEADSISIRMQIQDQKVDTEHFVSQDILSTLIKVIKTTGFELAEAQITNVTNDGFHACLIIKSKKKKYAIDCRPSEAILLALVGGIPIYIAKPVLDIAGINVGNQSEWEKAKQFYGFLKSLDEK